MVTQAQIQEILSRQTTKTAKIIALLNLGMTRIQIADLEVLGRYGAIQNVFAKYIAQTALGLNPASRLTFSPSVFDRKFGIEIEAFGIETTALKTALRAEGLIVEIAGRTDRTPQAWKITRDSSISGNNAFEIVSPILEGQNGLEQLRKVSSVLTRLRAKINKSCGLHVHFDAEGFNLPLWKNLIQNYATLEDTIDAMMPAGRRDSDNRYCRSIKKIANLATKIEQSQTIQDIMRIVFGSDRYYKLNAQSYTDHKTIEFRQHSGTIEWQKIENWVLFLHNLVSYSKNEVLATGDFEQLRKFNQPAIVEFYHNRIQDLAA